MYHVLDVLVAVTGNPPFLSSKVAKYCSAVLGFVISIVPELELHVFHLIYGVAIYGQHAGRGSASVCVHFYKVGADVHRLVWYG